MRLTFYPLEFIRATYDRENRELPAIDPRRPITGYVEHAANNPDGIHGYDIAIGAYARHRTLKHIHKSTAGGDIDDDSNLPTLQPGISVLGWIDQRLGIEVVGHASFNDTSRQNIARLKNTLRLSSFALCFAMAKLHTRQPSTDLPAHGSLSLPNDYSGSHSGNAISFKDHLYTPRWGSGRMITAKLEAPIDTVEYFAGMTTLHIDS